MIHSPLHRTRVKFCGLVRPQDVDNAVALGVDAIGFVFYAPSKRYVHPEEAARLRRRLPSWVRAVGLFVNEPMASVLETVDAVGLDVVQAHGDETPEGLAPLRRLGIPYWKALRIGGGVEALLAEANAGDAASMQVGRETSPGQGSMSGVGRVQELHAGPRDQGERLGAGAGLEGNLDSLLLRGRVPADGPLVGRALSLASQAECCLLDSAGPGFGGSGHAFAWDVLREMGTSHIPSRQRFILAGGLAPDNVGGAIRQVNPFAVDVSSGIQGASAREKDAVRMADFMAAVMQADAARLLDEG